MLMCLGDIHSVEMIFLLLSLKKNMIFLLEMNDQMDACL
jgi:hypothetical protein